MWPSHDVYEYLGPSNQYGERDQHAASMYESNAPCDVCYIETNEMGMNEYEIVIHSNILPRVIHVLNGERPIRLFSVVVKCSMLS